MPHDANGKLLQVGDLVNIPCKIRIVHSEGNYCNLDVEFVYPMPAYPDQKTTYSALNTKQVVKVE